MVEKDRRSKLMGEILNGIKAIKLYAWEKPFLLLIEKVREKEMQLLRSQSFSSSAIIFLNSSAPIFVALLSFVTFSLLDSNNILNARRTFVSLSLFGLIRGPLGNFHRAYSMRVRVSLDSEPFEHVQQTNSL